MGSGEVIGRTGELDALAGFLDGIADGASGLLLEGDAGAGKTTLWLEGVAAARDRGACVLVARPAQAEAELELAGMGDLLEGVLDRVLGSLPGPQADALRMALLLERPRGAAPGSRALATAMLNGIRGLAAGGPVLVAVDDLQWLDAGSAGALAFVWRRLRGEPVGLLATRRSGEPGPGLPPDDDPRIRRLPLGPLSLGAVHRLLEARLGLILTRPALRRLHEVSEGNPLFALEFGRVLQRRPATMPAGEPLPLPDRLRDLGRARITALPPASQQALAAVAALSQPTISLVARVASPPALAPAFAAHVLVQEGERIRFSHPLLASAAYDLLDPLSRRRLHRELSELVEGEARARHMALAADGPDGAVAAALEQASLHAWHRGAGAGAAELCDRARALTPPGDEVDLHRRTVAAARYWFSAGETARATELLEAALATAPAGAPRAEALVALARVHLHGGDQPRARELAASAVAEGGTDGALQADAAQLVASAMFFMRENLPAALRHASGAARRAAEARDPHLLGTAAGMKAVIEAILGRADWERTLESAAHVGDAPPGRPVITAPGWHGAMIALWTDRADEAARLMRRYRDDAVARGDEGSLPLILAELAVAEFLRGRWPDAAALAEESLDIAVQAGQRPQQAFALSARALVRAAQGLEEQARADAGAALALAGDRGMAVARIYAAWALGILELSLERPQAAAGALAPLRGHLVAAGVREPGGIPFAADEVEALIRAERLDEAAGLLRRLTRDAEAVRRVSAAAAGGRCRGLLAAAHGDLGGALEALESALVTQEAAGRPFERARTRLALGTVQRRLKRRALARATLERAQREFEALGAVLWARRAGAEVARIGGRTQAPGGLTPTERRLAELVAEGRSNKEIAAVLFVTPKTVETQLSRIYGKLGVRSRTALAHRLSNL